MFYALHMLWDYKLNNYIISHVGKTSHIAMGGH